MDIKLVAFDLDGTMLNGKKKVSERNLKALQECVRRGIYIVPATGRTIEGIPAEIKNLPGFRYVITLNGGIVLDAQDSVIIDEHRLDQGISLEILNFVSEYHVMYDAYVSGIGISESRFYDNLDEYRVPKEVQKMVKATRNVVPSIKEYVRTSPVPIEKINLFFDNQIDREEMRRALNRRGDVIVSSSMANNLEINAIGATKGEGLTRLAEYLGLAMEETMALGDGENDFNMIRMAGLGVAMANGEEQLKKLADYVTENNEEDGAAKAIERFVL